MGANDIARNKKDDRGLAKAETSRRRNHSLGSSGTADWSGVDGDLLAKAVASVAKGGGALRLGYTRDGGAYAVGFYDGDDKHTEYFSPSEDMSLVLKGVIEDYE